MDNSLTCKFPGCGYSTTFSIPAEDRYFLRSPHCHSQLLVIHMEDYSHWENDASTAVNLSKPAKKKRRKRASQTEMVDDIKDGAKEVSVSNANATLPVVKLSKSAKKKRRKKAYQTEVVDSNKDTASTEPSQPEPGQPESS